MDQRERGRDGASRLGALLLGVLLVAAGIGLLAAQVYGLDLRLPLADLGWPVFVILPGLILLVIGLAIGEDPGVGLSIAGGIVTTVGLILAYQWMTNHWASWAYAWALVAPASVGAAMVLWGLLHLRRGVLAAGLGALGVGLVLFLIFFGFFEGLIGIGGDRGLAPLGRTALPFALIAAGVLVIVARLWPRRRRHDQAGRWRPAPPDVGQPQPPTEQETQVVSPPPADRDERAGS